MKRKYLYIIAVIGIIILAAVFSLKRDFKKAGPTIYYNGNILTLDDSSPNAESMLVVDGKILAVGALEEIIKGNSEYSQAQGVDLAGQTVLPGFIDVHTHFALSMFLEGMHDLSGFKHETNASVWKHFEEVVANSAQDEWVVCKGIDPILVKDLQVPTIQYLDSIAPSNPVVIFSQSLHSYWANSKAFELAGISYETKNPSIHSYYDKDEEGDFTGLIVEQEAFIPFVEVLKRDVLTSSFLSDMSGKVMKGYAKNGNTTIVSTGLTINDAKPLILTEHLSNFQPSLLSNLLAKIGQLPSREPMPRHFIYMRHDMAHLMPEKREGNEFYDIIGIKHWYDGSPYIGTTYMDEPYLETELTFEKLNIPKGTRGKGLVSKKDLKDFIRDYHQKDWQIAIHAQGDAAIEEVVEAYRELDEELDFTNSRHRLEHCMMMSTDQLETIKTLNLTPSFHINHMYYYGDALHEEVLGAERTDKIFPVRSAIDHDLIATLHADQPMFESLPFRLIQTAVERKSKSGMEIGGDEKITLMEALKSLTLNAAWQINMESKLGTIEKGKYADFIIVDKNPFATPVEELHSIICLETFINGNKVNYN